MRVPGALGALDLGLAFDLVLLPAYTGSFDVVRQAFLCSFILISPKARSPAQTPES